MKNFRKIWNAETNGFIIENKSMNEDYNAFYFAFLARFPDSGVTFTAFKNQVSRLKCGRYGRKDFSTRIRPLYSEQEKKSYIRIKIGEPNVWISKAQWVWLNTHPAEAWEHFSNQKKYLYIFLDGNNRNFSPDNIECVERAIIGIINQQFKLGTDPRLNRIRILQAKMQHESNLLGVKIGTHIQYGSYIRSKEVMRKQTRNAWRKLSPEERRKRSQISAHKQWEKIKNDPERLEKYRAYHREYARNHRRNK